MDVVYIMHDKGSIKIPFYDYDARLFLRLRSCKGGFWDADHRQFVLRDGNADLAASLFEGRPRVEIGRHPIVPFILDDFFSARWTYDSSRCDSEAGEAVSAASSDDTPEEASQLPPEVGFFPEHWAEQLKTELHSRKYTPKTRAVYMHYNQVLCRWLQKPSVTPEDIKRYLAYQDKTLHLSASSLNLAMSAFKFFYHQVLKSDTVQEQHRPRQDKRLPVVLSSSEIKAMLDAELNTKHRLLLMMVYASGLRVSEVVALKRQDIDCSRKAVLVVAGAGKTVIPSFLRRSCVPLKHTMPIPSITPGFFPAPT
jgi:integrase